MSLAFAGAMTSRATLSRLSLQLLPGVQPLSLAVPAPRAVMQRTLQRRPIAMATAVGAAYTAGRAPVVRAPHLAPAVQTTTCCRAALMKKALEAFGRISRLSARQEVLLVLPLTLSHDAGTCCSAAERPHQGGTHACRCRMRALAWETACAAWS